MQRPLLGDAEASEPMDEVDLTSPPPSPVNTGLFKRTPSLKRRSLEQRDAGKKDNCHYPVKLYLNNDITFSELIQTLDVIPVDYIHFDEIPANYLESLQAHVASSHAANVQTKAEYDALRAVIDSDVYPQAMKSVLLNAFCKRWELPMMTEEKDLRPRM